MQKSLRLLVVCIAWVFSLAIAPRLQAAAPADENFTGYSADGATIALPRTLGGFVYEGNGGMKSYITDKGVLGLTVGTGNLIVTNPDDSSTATYVEIHSSALTDNFKLVSLMIESFSFGWSDTFTVTGYDGGSGTTAVASDTINLTTSDSTGSITYAKNPSAIGGTLTFDSTWQNIDTIRFTKTSGSGPKFSIDNIDISTAVVPAPTVTSVSPTGGPVAGGTSVTLTGTNLTGATAVKFGATNAASFTVNSATQITATSPTGSAGTVDITVTTAGGTSATSANDQFTYVSAPTVTSISPVAGPTAGGTSVTITGTNLSSATAVKFGATNAASFTVNSASQITATSPAGSAGTVDITVTTAGGTSATSANDQFTYIAAPTVTALSPTSGPTAGGTTVVITGTNLTGATAVTFGATAATGFTVDSATQITATAPAGSAGTVNVRVTTGGGTSATGAGNQYTFVAAPTVTSISPTAGPTGGGTSVTITGTNLTGATAVKFGATNAASFTVNSATQITATSPAGSAGTVDITVTTAGGTSATSANDQFTYVSAPTVTSISPASGPAAGGTTVTITGTNLSSATAVTFGGTAAASFTVNSASQITATSPAGTGTVDITVTTPGGTSATSASDQFTYVPAPAITSISPVAGPTGGGTSVTLTGTNLSSATAVKFGATNAASFTVNSATQITATSPAGSVGTVDITVTTAGGTSATSANDQFTYVAAPTVTAVAPSTGPTAGGTTVVLTGTNFTGATAVAFGATAGTGITIDSSTQITVTAPAHAAGQVNVTVTTPGGTSATAAGNQYTYNNVPAVNANAGLTVAEAGTGTITATQLDYNDAEQADTAITYTLTTAPIRGALKLNTTTLTASDTFTQDDLNNSRVTYVHDGSETTSDSFTFSVSDGVGASVTGQTFALTITAINDAPTITAGGTLPYTENGAAAAIDTSIVVADADSANLSGATVSITANFLSGDTLGFTNQNGISGSYDSGTGVLSLTGSATVANYQTALRSVTYQSGSENPAGAGARTVSWVVDDGQASNHASNTATSTITITAVNDAPTFSGGATLAAVNEDAASPAGATLTSLLGANFSDVDTGNTFAGIAVVANAANSGTEGTWEYSTDGTTWFNVGTVSTSAGLMLNSATRLRFLPKANFQGTPGALTVHAVDSTASTFTSGSTRQTFDTTGDDATSAVAAAGVAVGTSITSVNDAPAGADHTVTTNEDTDYTFAAADFGFTDPNDSPANALTAVKITTIPGAGTLANNGTPVTAGTSIAVADITGGKLKFTPGANANGAAYASFTFQVQDDGGTTNGGIDLDASANTITIDVTAVNDAPVFTASGPFSVDETAGNGAAVGNVDAHNGDGGSTDAGIAYSITGGTGQTLFDINASTGAITVNATGAAALNYESATSYTLTVQANDNGGGTQTNTASVTINIGNVAPSVTASQSFSIAENSANATVVGSVAITGDTDGLTWSIQSGNTGTAFAISNSGQLTVATSAALNYEAATSFTLGIRASDGVTNSDQSVTIAVTDVAEAPVITSNGGGATASINVSEDTTAVTTVTATDQDAGSSITYSITGGADQAKFTIGSTTGALAFAAAPDFETPTDVGANGVYEVQVTATDNTSRTDTQDISVTVTELNDPPVLDASKSPVLATIAEDPGAPANGSTAGSTLVSALVDIGGALGNVTDPDNGAQAGIAVIGVSSQGKLFYTTNGGTNWTELTGTVSATSALFLAADANTRVYFQPNANLQTAATPLTDALTFKAWDRTTGTAGAAAQDPTGNTAVSTASDTVALTITPVADTPAVASPTINEDADSGAIAITRNAADGTEVTHYKITGITNGAVYNDSGFTSQVTGGSFIASAGATTNVYFRPTPNYFGSAGFTVQASTAGNDGGLGGNTAASVVTVSGVNDVPTLTTVSTLTGGVEDTAFTIAYADLAAAANEADLETASPSFRVEAVSTGTLTKGGTPVTAGATLLSTGESLVWTPAANAHGTLNAFTVVAWDGAAASATPVQVQATVASVVDTPTVTNATTIINVQTASGLVLSRAAGDGAEVTHFKITAITGGTLYLNDGTTQITNGSFITYAQGQAGLKFTPNLNAHNGSGGPFSFAVQAAPGASDTGISGTATATISVTAFPAITSALAVNSTFGAAFSYTITATNTPTSYGATSLPAGLSVDTATGVISGSAPVGTHSITLSATNGAGTGNATLVLTVGKGAATVAFTELALGYTGQPRPVAVTTDPAGLTVVVTYDGQSTPPTELGSYAVVATVNDPNYQGTASGTLTIGKGTQTIAFTPPGVTIGIPATLSATASSGLPVTFSVVSGDATIASGNRLIVNAPGTVVLRASQAGDDRYLPASTDATLADIAKIAQTIDFAPLPDKTTADAPFVLSATASSGLPVSFAIVSGPAMLDGATLTLGGTPGVVVVRASQAGNATYAPAPDVTRTFTVVSAGPRVFVGDIVNKAGTIDLGDIGAVLPPTGNEGDLMIISPTFNLDLALDFTLDASGRFVKTITVDDSGLIVGRADGRPIAAAPRTLTLRGELVGNVLSGRFDEIDLAFTTTVQGRGPTSGAAGFYESSTLNSAGGATYTIVGNNGEVLAVATAGGVTASGRTTLNSNGTFSFSDGQLSVRGTVDAPTTTVTGTISRPGEPDIRFSGIAEGTLRTDRLINLSSRARIGPDGNRTLIAGFVIGGNQAKRVLLRAVGPALATINVTGAITNPRLRLYDSRGQLLLENDDWTGAESAEAMNRTGAFALPAGSRDAALVTTLAPGAYTMHVIDGGETGIALAEIYDATSNPAGEYQRLVNISSRGMVEPGDGALIGGFVVTGNSPKRVLVRGSGPALAATFGLGGTLADPRLVIYSGQTPVAENNDWGTPVAVTATQVVATGAEIAAAAQATGAFRFDAGSKDAAVIVTLAPGAYTAHVSGTNGAAGVALIEVYEIPE